jgi:hypothetical protein
MVASLKMEKELNKEKRERKEREEFVAFIPGTQVRWGLIL